MEDLLLFALGVIVAVAFIVVLGSRSSLGALLVPKDVQAATRKAAGGSTIVDAKIDPEGRFDLTMSGFGGPARMTAFRKGEITVSVGVRSADIPESGSFAFWPPQAAVVSGSRITPEVLDHIPEVIEKTLESKGFRPAAANEAPTLLIRCHVASDEPIEVRELDRLHGFADEGWDSCEAALTAAFRQGSLIIDVSAGEADHLLWRAAAVAEVSLEDELPKKLARIDRAVVAMLEDFPPKRGD